MNIEIKNINDALNKYNNNLLNPELDNYLISEIIKSSKNINELSIKSNLGKDEQDLLINAIHNNYNLKFKDLKLIDKYDDYLRLILLLLGVFLISISQETSSFISEISLIAGWVFIWEMLYDILFKQIKRKRKAVIYRKLSKCKINFIK